jgi:hypothetical protein
MGYTRHNLSYVLCILCCQFLWIVLFITPSVMLPVSLDCLSSLPLRYSLKFICPVSCVPNVASFSLATQSTQDTGQINAVSYVTVSLDCPFYYPFGNVAGFFRLSFFITPSVFSNMYLSCVMCTQCCQFLLNVLFYYPFGIL